MSPVLKVFPFNEDIYSQDFLKTKVNQNVDEMKVSLLTLQCNRSQHRKATFVRITCSSSTNDNNLNVYENN